MGERFQYRRLLRTNLVALGVLLVLISPVYSQKRRTAKKSAKPAVVETAPTAADLSKLRDEYIKATKDYKASLQRLLTLYQESLKKVEDRRAQMQKLLADGLVSQHEVEQADTAVADAKLKVTSVEQQIAGADTQIANALIEIETEKQMAKFGAMRKGSIVRTTSFIRFAGAGRWVLSQAGSIESFFQQTFKRPLPIAVFGQGAIHNQWRLDHRNAMDISLNPDGPEGQALIKYLQSNGIPFSAFRGAIPGVATGPHIHIGLPSHRY